MVNTLVLLQTMVVMPFKNETIDSQIDLSLASATKGLTLQYKALAQESEFIFKIGPTGFSPNNNLL